MPPVEAGEPDEEAEALQRRVAEEHRLIHVRMLGWMLIASWQLLSLLSEFVPIDLTSKGMRVTGKVLGLVGLILVAYGFERLAELGHRFRGLHE